MIRRGVGRSRAAACAGALLALCAMPAAAHTRSSSTSTWEIAPGAPPAARIGVRATWTDLQAALPGAPGGVAVGGPDGMPAVDRYLQQHFRLEVDGRPCGVVGTAAPLPSPDPSHVGRAWSVVCAGGGTPVAIADGFFEVVPSHLHLARFHVGGAPVVERVFVSGQRRFALPGAVPGAAPPAPQGTAFLDYVKLGVEHIGGGADHLAFLLALLLAGSSVLEVATLVTGFTAAHSVTLALGVLGVVRPASAAIEALIGLSIAIVALENFAETVGARTRRGLEVGLAVALGAATAAAAAGAFAVPPLALAGVALFSISYFALIARTARPGRWRWFIAFVFGLVHGFGFAGALAESALPAGRVANALLGFNVGVEIGQLVVVAVAWPLLRVGARAAGWPRPLWIQLGSTPILAAGVYWFLSRGIGG